MASFAKCILLILFAAPLLFLVSCTSAPPKEEIRQALTELITAIEAKKHRTVTNKLTKTFLGNNRLNQRSMSALVFRYYLRHQYIKIYTIVNSIEITSKKRSKTQQAIMTFHAALTSTTSVLPEHMRIFKITAYWEKSAGSWKMSKANWVEVRPQSIYPKFKEQMVMLENN